jgi:predicted dehydrogenase
MRIGIIGCGLIGQKRAAALCIGDTLAMVCDSILERAQTLAGRFGARAVEDWRDLVRADLDSVIVATSHDSLASIALAAVEARKNVLIEKPTARNLQELLPVRDAARRHGVVVKAGYNHRFHPGLMAAKKIVSAGSLGPLHYVRGRYGHGGRKGYEREWRCRRELSGGGELIDQGAHLIDLSRWFLGDLTLEHAATPTYFWPIDVEDNCFLALRGNKGEIAWLHASWTEWKNTFSFEISGRDGKLTIDGLGGSYGTERLTFHKMLPQMGPPETTIWEYPFSDTSWTAEFADFRASHIGKTTDIADIEDACAILGIVEAAYRTPSRRAFPWR